MIELELTEEHKALQATVREFVEGEVAPHIKEWDEKSYFEPKIFDKWPSLACSAFVFPNNTAERVLTTFRSGWSARNLKLATLFFASRCPFTSA